MPDIIRYVHIFPQTRLYFSAKLEACIMAEGIVQFEVEIASFSDIRSRVVWPDSQGPWIDGGLEELMVHFTYASWTSYMLECAISLALSSQDEVLGQTISDILTHTVESMGAVELGEIRMTREALDELRDSRTDV